MLCLKDPQMGDDNLFRTSDSGGGLLEQVVWVLAIQRKNLSINNYQLFIETQWCNNNNNNKDNNRYMELCCFLLYLRDKWGIWLVQSMLLNFLESEVFAGEALSHWRDFFSYSPVFSMDIEYLLSSDPKNMYFCWGFPGEQTFLIISYSSTTFWLVSQSNALIYICGKSIPSTYQILIGHPIKPQYIAQSAGAVEYTDCASVERPPPQRVS